MKALFGSVKKAFGTVSKAAKTVVKKIGKAATSAVKNIGNAVVNGAKNLKNSLSGMVSEMIPKIKNGLINFIKVATQSVGFVYNLWGDNIEMIDDGILILIPGGFIIKGLNTIGATDIHPTKVVPKALARLFYRAVDAIPGDGEQILYETILFGFKYDYEQNITYTIPEAPQGMVGYTPTYDLASRDIGFDIAAQIITFTYGGKEYMIEVWKGDYGGAAGSEVGIYVRNESDDYADPYFYNCAVNEPLHMWSELINTNKDEVLFTRDDTHWWLTGFKPCEYLEPGDLTLHVGIDFKNEEMAKVFKKELDAYLTAKETDIKGSVVTWIWFSSNTDAISDTVEDYVGKDTTYDEMLENTLNQFLSGDLILSTEELKNDNKKK